MALALDSQLIIGLSRRGPVSFALALSYRQGMAIFHLSPQRLRRSFRRPVTGIDGASRRGLDRRNEARDDEHAADAIDALRRASGHRFNMPERRRRLPESAQMRWRRPRLATVRQMILF